MSIGGRWAVALLAALAVSLSANLCLGGLVAGRAFHERPSVSWSGGPGDPRGRPERGVGRFLEGVPPPARPVVRVAFQERRAELGERMRAVRGARQALSEAIARADATPAQIEAALSELRAREGELQAAAHGALAAAITALPPEVRAQWRANGRNGP